MSAQSGGAVSLDYGPQPAQAQSASAILLEYAAPTVTRRLACSVRAPWGAALPLTRRWRAPMERTAQLDRPTAAPWGKAAPLDADITLPWGVAARADTAARIPWGAYGQRPARCVVPLWGVAVPMDTTTGLPWGEFARHPARAASALWLVARALDETTRAPWGAYASRHAARWLAVVPASRPADLRTTILWLRYSRPLAPGWGVVTEPGGPETDDQGTIIVPVRRVYMITNSASLMRLDNSQPIQALEMSVGIDADSWAWTFSATLPAAEYASVLPATGGDPVEVEATINGWPFRALIEQVRRTRRFGQHAVSVQGRSLSAWLASPYAAASSRDNAGGAITAQQIIDAALLNTGWTLDWQITDWLVSAGAFAHTGTPLEVATTVAGAVGASVQTDPSTTVLHIMPRYAAMPWEWGAATPDIALPPDILTEDGVELRERPHYNRAFVSGTTLGVLGQVTRTGTAGDLVAPLVTAALITHADAARQRGRAILGDTGRQYHTTITLPLTDDVTLLTPGLLIAGTEGAGWRGVSRGLTVRAWSEGGALRVRQGVEIERHEEEVA